MGTNLAGITVGELKAYLKGWPEHMELTFGGLTFQKFNERGPELLQMEFNQTVYLDSEGVVRVIDPDSLPRELPGSGSN
jgi:hypothetical protein